MDPSVRGLGTGPARRVSRWLATVIGALALATASCGGGTGAAAVAATSRLAEAPTTTGRQVTTTTERQTTTTSSPSSTTSTAAALPMSSAPPPRPPSAPPTTAPAPTSPTTLPPSTETPAPSAAPVTLAFVDVSSPVAHGNSAHATVQTVADALCTITVTYKSGPSKAQGLGPQTAGSSGVITWSWIVGTRTTPGSWPIDVTCSVGAQRASAGTTFVVS